METRVIAKGPLAIWVFGPVGAGKSLLISRLPLDAFRIVDQDALLEEELARRGLCLDATQHTATERTQFQSIRRQVAAALWNQVPVWRKEGINLCFETTGDKPHLFEAELIANRNRGYQTLGCALNIPLDKCLAQNRVRSRVLSDETVAASWTAFQNYLATDVYSRLFAGENLEICTSVPDAEITVTSWLAGVA